MSEMPQLPEKKTAFWRRALSAVGTFSLTGLTVTGAVAALIALQGPIADRADARVGPAPAPSLTVQTRAAAFQDSYSVTRRFPGQIEAAQQTGLSFEFAGTLAEVLVDEGDEVARGALIATLDTRLTEAERQRLLASRAALQAQTELARRTNDRRERLRAQGHISDEALDQTSLALVELEARIAEVDAALVSVDLQIEKSQIFAPFDGTIATRERDTGAIIAPGQPVVTVLERDVPQFRVGLPQDVTADILTQSRITVRLGETEHPATLAFVLPELDPTTRTRTVLFNLADGVRPAYRETGMLEVAQTVADTGTWLPLSALQEGERGLWNVTVVIDGDTEGTQVAAREAVEVLHATAEQAFVRGTLSDGAAVVIDGAHRVVPGQHVIAQPGAE